MIRKITILSAALCLCGSIFAARPTVHASNLSFSTKHCNSVTLTWTNGDGKARVIVAREGAATTFVPVDNYAYNGNPAFGKSIQYGTGNYIIYNSNATNFVKIDSLKQGKTYFFSIYEHDNNGISTLYYTTGAPRDSVTTYSIQPGLQVTYYDSCQGHNLYKFNNTSVSDIPGLTYIFNFGDGDTSSLQPAMHAYKISGYVPATVNAITNIRGCKNTAKEFVRVYMKKVVFFDFNRNHDTVQGFYNNHFKMYTGNYSNPLSGSYGYRWFTESDTGAFSFFDKIYDTDGRHKVSLEITTNISKGPNTYPTGCKDTLSFTLLVLNDALESMNVNNGSIQSLDTNNFIFSNYDSTLVSQTWLFGDGDSSSLAKASHSYKDSGKYKVILKGRDNAGYYHEKSLTVEVTFTPEDTIPTTFINEGILEDLISIYPNPTNGQLTVETNDHQTITGIIVFDMIGGRVREISNREALSAVEMNLSDLETGHYMLRIQTGNSITVKMIQVLR